MAQSLTSLQQTLKSLPGVKDAYIQPPDKLDYPCIMIEQDDNVVRYANNIKYFKKNSYTLTVMDRDPRSAIPDAVEDLPHTRRIRSFRSDGLNHTLIQIFY